MTVLLGLLISVAWPATTNALPLKAVVYYPWFSETTFGRYTPTLGFYSSDDQAVVDQHIKWIGNVPLDVGIASWWGPNTHNEQTRIPLLLNRTQALRPKLRWTIYHEAEGYANPTVAQLQADLSYLASSAAHPQWLRLNGKPVVFVYNANDSTCEVADRWRQAAPGWYVVLKVFPGYTACANQPDSWHQYSPASATQSHPPHSYAISPGFWPTWEATPRLARNLNRWKQNAVDCVKAPVTWCLITTFNEHGEGSGVEPTTEWTDTCAGCSAGHYLHALWKALQPTPPPPPPSGDPVITAAGDISCPSTSCNDDETALLLEGTALTLGDNQYDTGTQTQYESYFSWPRTGVKSAPGNHDPCTSSYYDEWFTPPGCWYSYDLGQWHLISLDSNVPSNSTQLGWLTNDLQSNTRQCVLAYWHHPRYSSGNYSPGISSVQPFLTRLVGKVDVVLNGHDHVYERFGVRDGYRQFTVGTGGRSHYSFGTPQPFSEVRNSTAYGVLKLTLHASSYDWQFVPVSGSTFTDAGSGVCS